MKKLHGVVTPIITPLIEDGQVDYASIGNLTTSLIGRGSDCIYVCGTTGGVTYLSLEERKRILETVWKASAGRALVYAQIGGTTLENSLKLAAHAVELGVDGLGVLTPTYYPLSDEELEDYYVAVSRAVPEDMPIYIYAIPGLAVNDMSAALVERIAERCPNIVGIKYSANDMIRLCAFRQIRNGEFSVMVAPLEMAYAAFSIGCDGIVSGTCHVFTEKMKEMYVAYKSGDLDTAMRIQKELLKYAPLVREKEMAKCKAYLCHEGIIATDIMRAPMKQISTQEKETLFSGMEGYKIWVDAAE